MAAIRSGIPTIYRSTQFRSRLEARWAAFFDLIRWRWVYEPFDANGYIPDFLIQGEWPLLIEVGPCMGPEDFIAKSSKADTAVTTLGRDLLVVGVSPLAGRTRLGGDHNPAAGYLGEYWPARDGEGPAMDGSTFHEAAQYSWAPGLWGECFQCLTVGVVHSEDTYCLRPCGHHQSGSFGKDIQPEWLEQLWRRAGNDVQWRANGPQHIGDVLRALR